MVFQLSKEKRFDSPRSRFLILAGCALIMPLFLLSAFQAEGDLGYLISGGYLFILLPISSALIPWWAARGRVHPMAACLPIGFVHLFLPGVAAWFGLASMLIGLVSATAGQEWEKRNKTKQKGRPHEGTARK